MQTWVWVVVAVVVVVLLLMIFARRTVAGGVDPTQLLLEPELVDRVRTLARANQKISAIKLLRDGTPGLGLGAAKQMVDRMAAAPKAPAPADVAGVAATGSPAEMPGSYALPLEVELQVRALSSAGQRIQAVKLVREHSKWDLRTAVDYVDGL